MNGYDLWKLKLFGQLINEVGNVCVEVLFKILEFGMYFKLEHDWIILYCVCEFMSLVMDIRRVEHRRVPALIEWKPLNQ